MIVQEHPDAVVVMLTGHDDVGMAVTCVRKGAFDYIVKPVDEDRLCTTLAKAMEHQEVRTEAQRLHTAILEGAPARPELFADIVTVDPRMISAFRYVEAIAPSGLPILVTGETGVGKELLAHAVHRASDVRGEFVTVNCAGVDDQLFSDTLFGHTKDAYTGASGTRQGLVARAKNGTVFLDEIGDLHPDSQVKLLRLLQEGTYYPLGSDTLATAQCRFVAATNADLARRQKEGTFRRDLYFRLQAHEVRIPPLRERKGDIAPLLSVFLRQAAESMQKKVPTPPPNLVPLLSNYEFPGNVRELRGMVFDAVGRHRAGVLSSEAFREAIGKQDTRPADGTMDGGSVESAVVFPGELPTADVVECALVVEALRRTKGNKSLAAHLVGMSRQTFKSKLKQSGYREDQDGGQN
jgi:DNA-binding NtrC family response regulator